MAEASSQDARPLVKWGMSPCLLGLCRPFGCLPHIIDARTPDYAKRVSRGWLDDLVLATSRRDPVAVEDFPCPDLRIH